MLSPSTGCPPPSVAVIGGGVAGLAAAVAAVEQGFRVELFEQAPQLGGRAGSYRDTRVDRLIDLSPHVAMGCCTNLLDFCRRTNTSDGFDRFATLHFFGPDGRRYDFAGSRWLPAPLHLMPALRRLGYLAGRDRRAIARAMLRLARWNEPDAPNAPTMGDWLRRQNQPETAMRRFWSVVLESALGDKIDHVSVSAARKVLVDGFMATPVAYELFVPRVPLGEIWEQVGSWLCSRGAAIRLRVRIERLQVEDSRIVGIALGDGSIHRFDHVVSAVSWKQLGRLLGPELLALVPQAEAGAELSSSPITAVHLWFDRPIMDIPHAALIGRLSQWVFPDYLPSPSGTKAGSEGQRHYTVVISASHALVGRESQEVLQDVLADLRAVWPASGDAKLLHHRVLTQPAAVFSLRPGAAMMRPQQPTPIRGFALAGDWTATDWPATMEGAVRSGRLAIEALLAALGRPQRLLTPDLQKGWLMRWIAR